MVTREQLENALRDNGWCRESSTSTSFSYSKETVMFSSNWCSIYISGKNVSFSTDVTQIKLGKGTLTAKSIDGLSVKLNL